MEFTIILMSVSLLLLCVGLIIYLDAVDVKEPSLIRTAY